MEYTVADNKQVEKTADEQVQFIIPWAEKRKELGGSIANEEMVAQHWDMNEELVFFYIMWLGTY